MSEILPEVNEGPMLLQERPSIFMLSMGDPASFLPFFWAWTSDKEDKKTSRNRSVEFFIVKWDCILSKSVGFLVKKPLFSGLETTAN